MSYRLIIDGNAVYEIDESCKPEDGREKQERERNMKSYRADAQGKKCKEFFEKHRNG